MDKKKTIAVLDFGGQYAHLIASRVRRLGSYTEIVFPEDLTAAEAVQYAGIIYSGGPSSVYEENAPVSRPEILNAGVPVLGICYGHQLMMHQLGGQVEQSKSREYGPAYLNIQSAAGLFENESVKEQFTVWMSHGDEVTRLPEGFEISASTEDCRYAAVSNHSKKLYGLQFHPEVKDTVHGDRYLLNFLKLCGSEGTWSLSGFLDAEIGRIREQVKDKKVFMLISGGVDSTVAFAVLSRALPADHIRGLFVDTGFMRLGETDEVKNYLKPLGVNLEIADESERFFEQLKEVYEPEAKRRIIGNAFLDVQAAVSEELGLNPDEWFLGQGTIYPDTIESGSTKNSQTIKTHHNRVERIARLIEEGKITEPVRDLYKDEVRELGKLLGIPESVVMRHPFPGPGLAVRTLCSPPPDKDNPNESLHSGTAHGFDAFLYSDESVKEQDAVKIENLLRGSELHPVVLPVQSVGVQGDKRTYAHPAALFPMSDTLPEHSKLREIARIIPNTLREINRVLLCTGSRKELGKNKIYKKAPVYCDRERVNLLQQADRIVHNFQIEKKIYSEIWQFPVVLVPLYMDSYDPLMQEGGRQVHHESGDKPESIILRPVNSIDAMTASYYPMDFRLLEELSLRLLSLVKVDMVFLDITSKPPGTIEWE